MVPVVILAVNWHAASDGSTVAPPGSIAIADHQEERNRMKVVGYTPESVRRQESAANHSDHGRVVALPRGGHMVGCAEGPFGGEGAGLGG